MSCGITWYGARSRQGEGEFCVSDVGGICSTIFTVLGALSNVQVTFVILPNMSAISVNAATCLSPMFEKVVAGADCFRAWISSFGTIMEFSAEDLYGILQL